MNVSKFDNAVSNVRVALVRFAHMAKLLTARGFEKTRNYSNGRGWQGIGLVEKAGV